MLRYLNFVFAACVVDAGDVDPNGSSCAGRPSQSQNPVFAWSFIQAKTVFGPSRRGGSPEDTAAVPDILQQMLNNQAVVSVDKHVELWQQPQSTASDADSYWSADQIMTPALVLGGLLLILMLAWKWTPILTAQTEMYAKYGKTLKTGKADDTLAPSAAMPTLVLSKAQKKRALNLQSWRDLTCCGPAVQAPPTKTYGLEDVMRPSRVWENAGRPWRLFFNVAIAIAPQAAALSVVTYHVFWERASLMSCDDRQIGVGTACVCEWTKAYVRCFPLLALVVSVTVCQRMILLQRIYYEMLRRKAVLDFDYMPCYKDPLFWFLMWVCVNAAVHLGMNTFMEQDLATDVQSHNVTSARNKIKDSSEIVRLYFVPAFVFLAFLWRSYDIEKDLVTLNGYLEEDPATARKDLADISFIKEDVAADISRRTDLALWTSKDTLVEIIRCADQEEVQDESLQSQKDIQFPRPQKQEAAGRTRRTRTRLFSSQWAAEILLDIRMQDYFQSAARFRAVFAVFCFLSLVTLLWAFAFFTRQIVKDIDDISQGNFPDICSLLVTFNCAIFTLWIFYSFVLVARVPFKN